MTARGGTTKHIASCSFGKDSIATVILAKAHGEPLDEVVYCEVMFTEEISGEVPEHRDFIYNIAIPRFEAWGIKTIVLRSEKTYVSEFTRPITKGPNMGKLKSFPLCGRCNIQRDCKIKPIRQYQKSLEAGTVQYIGIANDEQERLMRLDGVQRVSLMAKYGISEAQAFEMCKAEGLLSPIYAFTDRGGCWFCPNAKEKELRHLYDHHRDLWQRMLELQALPNKVTERFNYDMTFGDIDEKFKIDDAQLSLFDFMGVQT